MKPTLPPLPDESFSRVLCVAAHPDDLEYGTAAAVAVWTGRGVDVRYLLLTRGEAGIDSSDPAVTGPLRTAEQVAAGAAVGVAVVEFLDHHDGVLEYGLPLRRDIARTIRDFQPDVVVVGSWQEELGYGLNQADHRAAGLATLDAVRDAGNRWVFRELLDDMLQPWSARWLLVTSHTDPTHGVEVDGPALERGIAALEAHHEYLSGLGDQSTGRDLVTMITASQGRRLGVPNAVLMRVLDLGE